MVKRGKPLLQHCLLWLVILSICFLSLLQPVTAMLPHASTLSVYALNANGFVSTAKIHLVNNMIHLRRPHLFVISKTKTSSKMSSRLPTQDYNIYEETGI